MLQNNVSMTNEQTLYSMSFVMPLNTVTVDMTNELNCFSIIYAMLQNTVTVT